MTIKSGANCRELGKMNVPSAALDPVIGQARHAENAGGGFLGEPQDAAAAPQCRPDAGLQIFGAIRLGPF
jgi:hypothetical protein